MSCQIKQHPKVKERKKTTAAGVYLPISWLYFCFFSRAKIYYIIPNRRKQSIYITFIYSLQNVCILFARYTIIVLQTTQQFYLVTQLSPPGRFSPHFIICMISTSLHFTVLYRQQFCNYQFPININLFHLRYCDG